MPVREREHIDAVSLCFRPSSLRLPDQPLAMLRQVELPNLFRPIALKTTASQGLDHLGLVLDHLRLEDLGAIRLRIGGHPVPKRRRQLELESRLSKVHLHVTVTRWDLLPRSMSPADVRHGLPVDLRNKAASPPFGPWMRPQVMLEH